MVATMNDLVERGSSAYQKSSAMQMRGGVLITLLGVLFLGFGLASAERSYFLIGAGVLFLGLGSSMIYSAVRFKQK
jgi:hypothetical protein